MNKIKLAVVAILFFSINNINAQMIADFETSETTPSFSAEGETAVVDNPDASGINPSSKVGYYKKVVGAWKYVTMDFPDTVKIGFNNTLTFKLRASTQGRIFAKFWIGDEILIESWAPEYGFRPLPDNWTECEMDLTPAMGKAFTKLELAACVDNDELAADVYFDDVLLSNPDVGDGTPKALFTVSTNKAFIGTEITFDASKSYDFDGDIVEYSWNYDDDSIATGEIVKRSFDVDGTYNVTLTVTDNDGKASSVSQYVFILDETEKLSKLGFINKAPSTNEKIEAVFQVNKNYTNAYDPDEVTIDAEIQYPNGNKITMPCFYFVKVNLENTTWVTDTTYQSWMLRFVSEQAGTHIVKLILNDIEGEVISDNYSIEVTSGSTKGIVRNDSYNNQYYRHTTGEPFYPFGINIGWNSVDHYNTLINNLSAGKANIFRYWHTPFARQALEWVDYGIYKGLGYYNQEAAAMSDYLIDICEDKDMYMQLVIFQHGMFSENVNAMWEDNPYNTAKGGYVDRAEEYFRDAQCKAQTKKLLRYIVARWSYSKNIFAWEFFNEVQFTGIHNSQSSDWFPGVLSWHSEMSQYIQSIDPFNHIMTTSAEHDQIPQFDTIKALDNIQYHLYSSSLLPDQKELDYQFQDELSNLSIINGEYGTNAEAETPFEMQRNSIWNGIMTQVPRYMWIWEHYEDMTWANLFTMPANYLNDEDLAKDGELEEYIFKAQHDTKSFVSTGLTSGKNFYGYIYEPSYTGSVVGAELKLTDLPFANYKVTYYLPESNIVLKTDSVALIKLTNTLELPEFSYGIAFKLKYLSKYTLPIALSGNDTVVAPGVTVSFSADRSFSQVTGATLTYLWGIDEKPEGSNSTINGATSMNMDVIPDASGIYKISLVVNDGINSSKPDVVTIVVSNVPIADAGNDTTFVMDTKYFSLDGSNSYDADGDEITYKWELVEKPEASRGNLLNFKKAMATLEIDKVGDYAIVLVVHDGISSSIPDTIRIHATETDISMNRFHNLRLYPNPTKGVLSINANEAISLIEVFDFSGRKLFEREYNYSNNLSINMNEIATQSGVFIVKISNNNKAVFERVIYNN